MVLRLPVVESFHFTSRSAVFVGGGLVVGGTPTMALRSTHRASVIGPARGMGAAETLAPACPRIMPSRSIGAGRIMIPLLPGLGEAILPFPLKLGERRLDGPPPLLLALQCLGLLPGHLLSSSRGRGFWSWACSFLDEELHVQRDKLLREGLDLGRQGAEHSGVPASELIRSGTDCEGALSHVFHGPCHDVPQEMKDMPTDERLGQDCGQIRAGGWARGEHGRNEVAQVFRVFGVNGWESSLDDFASEAIQ
mmetsp:Transcript_24116/g.70737  ORF Transcript_24116/g.70737 Transcript_24116/m.70737 type:complete len:251 (+) Transcript_24116:333-1085(+)